MIDLLTCRDLARIYHVTPRRIRFLAQLRKIGGKLWPGGPWLFSQEEAQAMKPGKAGSKPGPRIKREVQP